jgi:cell division protein FtsW
MVKKGLIKKLFYGDVSIWIIFLLLCCLSLTEVFSATSTQAYKHANMWAPIIRHTSILFIGAILTIVLSHVHYKYFSLAILLLPVTAAMLLITPLIGLNINHAARSLELFGFQFQPSEVAKLACIVYIAFWLSKRGKISDSTIYKIIVWGFIPICLFIAYGNLSTAILLGTVCFLMMFLGCIPLKKLGKLLLLITAFALIGGLLIYTLPHDTVKKYIPRAATWQNRVIDYFNFEKSEAEKSEAAQRAESAKKDSVFIITDDNYQVNHAKMAIARGGIIGNGPGRSVQRDVLPQAYSDFIYAIIIEELGIVGGIGVLILYIMLMIRVGVLVRRCDKFFPQYLVLGCGMMIVIQALMNISVAVNLIPVTGQPLPLICQGGTSTILTCTYMGIILSISHFGAKMDEEDETEETEEDREETKNEDKNETETSETTDDSIESTVDRTDK